MFRRPAVLLIPLLLAVAWTPSSGASHFEASFSTPGGNAWWVEVYVDANQPLAGVDARDDGGAWIALEKKSWGAWAKSFHVEDGSIVEFRARSGDGDSVVSGGYAWPGGDPADGDGGGGDPGAFEASFSTPGGNSWWVEVYVTADEPLAGVDARDDGGAWIALEKKSWGAWAKSFHVEDGSIVEFRARSTDGDSVVSQGHVWPSGDPAGGGGGGGDPSFDAAFSTPGGNAWWVEVYVDANQPLAGVDARDDGGPWIALEKKSWGAWAKSFHVEDGSIVEFRARSTDGDSVVSQGYVWPSGDPAGAPPPPPDDGGADVAFGPKAGNSWWVEAIVVGDGEPVEAVEARATGGGWHTMTYREWGSWAASFHVPAGADVEFRATTPSGTDTSVPFTWPEAKPVGSDGSWPEEGGYARYDETTQEAPGVMTQRHVDHVYHDGAWWSHATGFHEDPGGRSDIETWGREGPTFCRTAVAPGDDAGCLGLTARGAATEETRREGDRFTAATWRGDRVSDCGCDDDAGEWDQATGILIGFHNSGTSWRDRLLLDTDAPMKPA